MKRLPHFWRDTRGTAALELTLLAPLFISLLLGFYEIHQYLRTLSVVERTAFSIGDMVAQRSSLRDNDSPNDSGNIGVYWEAAAVSAEPLDMKANGMVVNTVLNDAGGARPKTAWQRQASGSQGWKSGAVSQLNAAQPLPPGFPFYAGDNTVVVEVMYTFTPFEALALFLPRDQLPSTELYRRVYFRPRFQNLDTLQK